jgi:hypothetical protein
VTDPRPLVAEITWSSPSSHHLRRHPDRHRPDRATGYWQPGLVEVGRAEGTAIYEFRAAPPPETGATAGPSPRASSSPPRRSVAATCRACARSRSSRAATAARSNAASPFIFPKIPLGGARGGEAPLARIGAEGDDPRPGRRAQRGETPWQRKKLKPERFSPSRHPPPARPSRPEAATPPRRTPPAASRAQMPSRSPLAMSSRSLAEAISLDATPASSAFAFRSTRNRSASAGFSAERSRPLGRRGQSDCGVSSPRCTASTSPSAIAPLRASRSSSRDFPQVGQGFRLGGDQLHQRVVLQDAVARDVALLRHAFAEGRQFARDGQHLGRGVPQLQARHASSGSTT